MTEVNITTDHIHSYTTLSHFSLSIYSSILTWGQVHTLIQIFGPLVLNLQLTISSM
jgi:hypothetical protein